MWVTKQLMIPAETVFFYTMEVNGMEVNVWKPVSTTE